MTFYEFIKDDYRDFWTFSEISKKGIWTKDE